MNLFSLKHYFSYFVKKWYLFVCRELSRMWQRKSLFMMKSSSHHFNSSAPIINMIQADLLLQSWRNPGQTCLSGKIEPFLVLFRIFLVWLKTVWLNTFLLWLKTCPYNTTIYWYSLKIVLAVVRNFLVLLNTFVVLFKTFCTKSIENFLCMSDDVCMIETFSCYD